MGRLVLMPKLVTFSFWSLKRNNIINLASNCRNIAKLELRRHSGMYQWPNRTPLAILSK